MALPRTVPCMRYPQEAIVCACLGLLILFLVPARATSLETDFENGFAPWVPFYSGTWELQNQSGNHVAALVVAGADRPPVRRPRAYLFLPEHSWKDYTFTVKAKTLEAASLSFRDVVLIFGYVDDTHYYYAHVSSRADATHSIIMKMTGSQRATIHTQSNPTPALNGSWQTIRVEHIATGQIRVFVDNMRTPKLSAHDTSYPVGAVAFGCFDDRALFDDVSVSGTDLPLPAEGPVLTRTGPQQLTLSFQTRRGFTYQLLSGTSPHLLAGPGPSITGHGGMEQRTIATPEAPRRFFQVVTRHPLLAEP